MPIRSSLKDVQETWERLAQIDPLWAVLSEPEKLGGKWSADEFLRTGEAEITALVSELQGHGFDTLGSALDFGCGAGRLSIALASRFERVVSVDIAPTMIETARGLARERDNIQFIVNDRDDLSVIPSASVDLVYSNIVLQHMPPETAASYIREFYRVARPGGFVVFQIPSHLTEEWLPNGNVGTRLPHGSQQAEITFVSPPLAMLADETATITARIRNASDQSWTQDLVNQINLGNHWLSEEGDVISHDDARQRLPGRLDPGQVCELELSVHAPACEGKLILELDIVQEGVCWFSDHGSSTARQIVVVNRAGESIPTKAPTSAPESEYPTFLMNGIPHEEVKALIEACGGEVVDVHDHLTEWVSYQYVTKRN